MHVKLELIRVTLDVPFVDLIYIYENTAAPLLSGVRIWQLNYVLLINTVSFPVLEDMSPTNPN
jgi:hypothetical protein